MQAWICGIAPPLSGCCLFLPSFAWYTRLQYDRPASSCPYGAGVDLRDHGGTSLPQSCREGPALYIVCQNHLGENLILLIVYICFRRDHARRVRARLVQQVLCTKVVTAPRRLHGCCDRSVAMCSFMSPSRRITRRDWLIDDSCPVAMPLFVRETGPFCVRFTC